MRTKMTMRFSSRGIRGCRCRVTSMRTSEGQDEITIQQFSQMEDVLGSHNRSGEQIEIWDAAYGPIGDDGYPKPLWDKKTGKIDHSVALYMRDHGYDLSYNLRTNWATLGPKLRGKDSCVRRRHGQFLFEFGGV